MFWRVALDCHVVSAPRNDGKGKCDCPDLTAYLEQTRIMEDGKGPLFRTIGRGTSQLTRTPLPQANAYAMIRRRAAAAGIATKLGNHSFRARGSRPT